MDDFPYSMRQFILQRGFMKVDIGACFNYGIEKVRQNPVFYILGFFLVAGIGIGFKLIAQGTGFIASLVLQSLIDVSKHSALTFEYIAAGIIGLALSFFLAPFLVGYFRGIKKEYDGGKAEPLDVLLAVDVLSPSVANYAIAILLITAGFVCCIIPGIILAPLAPLTIFFLARGDLQGIDALKKAVEILKKNPVLILWNLVFGITGALGIILCFVGILVTVPISICAMYKLFRQVAGEEETRVVWMEEDTSSDEAQEEPGEPSADGMPAPGLTREARDTSDDSPYKLKK